MYFQKIVCKFFYESEAIAGIIYWYDRTDFFPYEFWFLSKN